MQTKNYLLLLSLIGLVSQNILAYKTISIEKALFITAHELGTIGYIKTVEDEDESFTSSIIVKRQIIKNSQGSYVFFYSCVINAVENNDQDKASRLFQELEKEYEKITVEAKESTCFGMRKFIKTHMVY